jgi:hypothetical protein
MIVIRFPNAEIEKRPLAFSPGGSPSPRGRRAKRLFPTKRCPHWRGRKSLTRSKALPRMNSSHRRYEILLPLEFNDGSPVPDELFAETLLKLRERFGAVSSESQTTQGQWQHEGQVFRDQLIRIYVDVPDTDPNREISHQRLNLLADLAH